MAASRGSAGGGRCARSAASIQGRAPRLSRTAAARFDPSGFSGLPLTLILVGAAYVAFLIGGIVEELMEAEELESRRPRPHRSLSTSSGPRRPSRSSPGSPPPATRSPWSSPVSSPPGSCSLTVRAAYILPVFVTIFGPRRRPGAGKFLFDRTRPDFLYERDAASPSFPRRACHRRHGGLRPDRLHLWHATWRRPRRAIRWRSGSATPSPWWRRAGSCCTSTGPATSLSACWSAPSGCWPASASPKRGATRPADAAQAAPGR